MLYIKEVNTVLLMATIIAVMTRESAFDAVNFQNIFLSQDQEHT